MNPKLAYVNARCRLRVRLIYRLQIVFFVWDWKWERAKRSLSCDSHPEKVGPELLHNSFEIAKDLTVD